MNAIRQRKHLDSLVVIMSDDESDDLVVTRGDHPGNHQAQVPSFIKGINFDDCNTAEEGDG